MKKLSKLRLKLWLHAKIDAREV